MVNFIQEATYKGVFMMFKMIIKLECCDCGSNTNLRKCTTHEDIVLCLCVDCLVDRTEDFYLEESDEEE